MKYIIRNILVTLILLPSCTKDSWNTQFGLNPFFRGYVPARTAVLNCALWPRGVPYAGMPMHSAKDSTLADFCKAMDQYVADGFSNQPYMRGYSFTSVEKLVLDSEDPKALQRRADYWNLSENPCLKCSNAPSAYTTDMATRGDWRGWLQGISRMVRNADAVLLPFVVALQERTLDDRGVTVMERRAQVVMLLVDTNNAQLLWSGERESYAQNSYFSFKSNSEQKMPDWSIVTERVLTEDVWKDFPGRQIYR